MNSRVCSDLGGDYNKKNSQRVPGLHLLLHAEVKYTLILQHITASYHEKSDYTLTLQSAQDCAVFNLIVVHNLAGSGFELRPVY